MRNCEFCDATIADFDGAEIPGAAMDAALNQGYRPMQCPHWDTMHAHAVTSLRREQGLANDAPVNEMSVYARWNELLRNPMKTWRLCNECCSTLGPYLPPRSLLAGHTSAGSLDGLEYVIPINTSLWAIAAGYFGLFCVLVFPAPIALILGIIALWDIRIRRDREEKIAGKGRAIFAIVMGALFTAVLLFMVAAIAFG